MIRKHALVKQDFRKNSNVDPTDNLKYVEQYIYGDSIPDWSSHTGFQSVPNLKCDDHQHGLRSFLPNYHYHGDSRPVYEIIFRGICYLLIIIMIGICYLIYVLIMANLFQFMRVWAQIKANMKEFNNWSYVSLSRKFNHIFPL